MQIYQYLEACATTWFTCRFKYSAHAIGHLVVGWTFCGCNLCTFFENNWPFGWFEPCVLLLWTYNPPMLSSFPPKKLIIMYLLPNKVVSPLLLSFLCGWKNCLVTGGICNMRKNRRTKHQPLVTLPGLLTTLCSSHMSSRSWQDKDTHSQNTQLVPTLLLV